MKSFKGQRHIPPFMVCLLLFFVWRKVIWWTNHMKIKS